MRLRCDRTISIVAASVTALLSAAAGEAQNLIVNPGFDDMLTGWTTLSPTTSWTSADGHASPGAAQCTLTSTGPGLALCLSQCLPVTALTRYDFGGSIRLSSAAPPTAKGLLTVGWHANGDCSSSTVGASTAPSSSATTWQAGSESAVAPAGAHSALLRLNLVTNDAGTFDAFFDDIFFQPRCSNTPTALCLHGRFEVVATFNTAQGLSGAAQTVRLTSASGYSWFFNPDNAELFVKVKNACVPPFNRYWVFVAGLTNVGVEITVTDTTALQSKTYTNPVGRPFLPIQDTDAFATCP